MFDWFHGCVLHIPLVRKLIKSSPKKLSWIFRYEFLPGNTIMIQLQKLSFRILATKNIQSAYFIM